MTLTCKTEDTPPNPRPYAQRARELCTETNHDDVWHCMWCWALEQRLTPISEMPAMRALIAEEALTWKVKGDNDA